MSNQKYGAGIWHFASYLDRYATDGYGPPRSLLETIDLAGQVRDLSVVDINFPWGNISVDAVAKAHAIPIQVRGISRAASNDGNVMQISRQGVAVGLIGLAVME